MVVLFAEGTVSVLAGKFKSLGRSTCGLRAWVWPALFPTCCYCYRWDVRTDSIFCESCHSKTYSSVGYKPSSKCLIGYVFKPQYSGNLEWKQKLLRPKKPYNYRTSWQNIMTIVFRYRDLEMIIPGYRG